MDLCELVSKHLYCGAMLELLVSKLYHVFSDKIKSVGKDKALLLKVISIESKTHADILELIAREYSLYKEFDKCADFVGSPWRVVEKLLNELEVGVDIDLKEFVERLKWVESAVGEETYHRVLLPLLSGDEVLEKCVGVEHKEALGKVIDKLIEDEKFHEDILKSLLRST